MLVTAACSSARNGHLRQSGARRGLPRSRRDPRRRRLLLCLCDADASRRPMDQHPGRAFGESRRLAASWRCPARKAGLGARDPGHLGALRAARRRQVPDVLFGDARRLPRSRARALPGGRDLGFAGRPVRRHGHAAAARRGLRIYRPDGVRGSRERQMAALLGLGIPADPGAGAWAGPDVVRCREASRPT